MLINVLLIDKRGVTMIDESLCIGFCKMRISTPLRSNRLTPRLLYIVWRCELFTDYQAGTGTF